MTDSGSSIDQVSLAIATRIRNWRKEKKLSLDELSRRAAVSKGMLVEIEKGAANPSIAILCKLAAALGVSVAEIVNVASEPLVHVIEAPAIPVLWQGEQGGSARLLAGTTGPDMIELWRWVDTLLATEDLLNISPFSQYVVRGLILLAAVIFDRYKQKAKRTV
jgi:transcriptional regulator with XRE-family HTH domain